MLRLSVGIPRDLAKLRYGSLPEFSRTRLATIEAGVRRKLGDDFVVTLREVAETEKTIRGKHRWIVSKLRH